MQRQTDKIQNNNVHEHGLGLVPYFVIQSCLAICEISKFIHKLVNISDTKSRHSLSQSPCMWLITHLSINLNLCVKL